MAEIVVRVFSKSGRSRISVPQAGTLSNLKEAVMSIQISTHLLVPKDQIILTYENKKKVMGKDSSKLSQLSISNGTILNLDSEVSIPIMEKGPPLGPMPLPDLVPQDSTEEKEKKTKEQFIRKCGHGKGTRCINCFANEKPIEKTELDDNT